MSAPADLPPLPWDGIERRKVRPAFPFIDLLHHDCDPALTAYLPEHQARRLLAVLLEDRGDTWFVGLAEPHNLRAEDAISALLKRPIEVARVDQDALLKTLDRLYGKTGQLGEFAREVESDIERETGVVDLNRMGETIDDVDAPVVKNSNNPPALLPAIPKALVAVSRFWPVNLAVMAAEEKTPATWVACKPWA